MSKKALLVGGNSGIGLAMVVPLLKRGYDFIYILGKGELVLDSLPPQEQAVVSKRVSFKAFNLIDEDYSLLKEIEDIDTLIITSGFGRVAHFEDLKPKEISNLIKCNELGIIQIIKHYYNKIANKEPFYCAVMGSIAGHVSSPLFSVYAASKAGVCRFVESINAELSAKGLDNRILDVSPGKIEHTAFAGGANDITAILPLADTIIQQMQQRETLYIPDYDTTYKRVINNYRQDPMGFGVESYEYKVKQNRLRTKPQLKIGYLSGTFDLFHVGHLNLLRNAKKYCDYLIVGVHESGAWKGKETFISLEDRMEIVRNIRYVDEVVISLEEDSDAYDRFGINYLFVGSDYKGTERFKKYEEYFADKDVEIIYFPYTTSVSSSSIRNRIKSK